jgi:hypothetical protein
MGPDDVIEGLHPLPGLFRVDVRELGWQPVADDGKALASGGHEYFLAFRGRAGRRALFGVLRRVRAHAGAARHVIGGHSLGGYIQWIVLT